MRQTVLNLPELALIASTRAAAGIGIGLLLAGEVDSTTRRTLGWALLLLGVVSTVPLLSTVMRRSRRLLD